ncbi:hypothetical protein Q0590_33815 [Rhodocytophaga aerolata]|uniref:Uncharacterized protein n=1 Tax=Rhodocytophaga aerolata TaxID=455078 RepID=A0ABT8RHV4_9BACT|nr:hypothetical protein [Rhodocytophaga aerolata]MDO1451301.1 hypothetical protein [Rhodocytophaga aerolata]
MTKIHRLSEAEFNNTFEPPMQLLGMDDESSKVNLKEYVENIILEEGLNTSIEDIEIHYVYHHPRKRYEHILLNYGIENVYATIVVSLSNKQIEGYHILDLNEKYSLDEEEKKD